MADGKVEYLGRKDDQVKIRGYRVELGEVESAISETDTVSTNCVIAKKDNSNSKRLISYYVPE
ncbi:MAG: hypothetical protein ACR2KZ_02165, partial [Segetibacter sp.]